MEKMRQPWNVSVIAQEAGIAALDEKDRVEKMRRMIQIERMEIEKQLDILKIDFVSSDANFILIYSEINLFEELLQYGILIRDCANYRGLETGWYRIAVKQRHENEQLLKALKEIIERNRQEADIDGKTDHDTGNDVECREECAGRRSLPHLEGDGYKTAPFKSQNMALNSYITKRGTGDGKAQVMQAEAAGIEPSADT